MMSVNIKNIYDLDNHLAEIYDQYETDTLDIKLICNLIQDKGTLRILEPFCGTGRILIPLAEMGHNLVGLDQSKGMLHQAQVKIDQLSRKTQNKIQLIEADATTDEWPPGFDLVILAGNCFYELATPEEQETCIAKAGAALNPSGFVYVDNNHMEGELDKSWQNLGVVKKTLSGICADGSHVQCTMETVWYDVPSRLARFRRKVTIRYPDGHIIERESIQPGFYVPESVKEEHFHKSPTFDV